MIGDPLFPDLGPKSEEYHDPRGAIALTAVGLLALPGAVSYNDYDDPSLWYRDTFEDIRYSDCKTATDLQAGQALVAGQPERFPTTNHELGLDAYVATYFEKAAEAGLEMYPGNTAYQRIEQAQTIGEAYEIAAGYFDARGIELLLDRPGFSVADELSGISFSPGDTDPEMLKKALLASVTSYEFIPQEMVRFSNLETIYLVHDLRLQNEGVGGLANSFTGTFYRVDVSVHGVGARLLHAHELGHLFDTAYCSVGAYDEDSVFHALYEGPNLRRENPHEEKATVFEELVGGFTPLKLLTDQDMYTRERAAHMLARIEQAVPGYGQLILDMDISPTEDTAA